MRNNSQLLAILLVFAFSFLSWLFRWLRERQAANRIKQDKLRRVDESIRTGRPGEGAGSAFTPPPPNSSQAELESLARRRQAQLKMLRERQQGTARSQPSQGQPVVLIGPGAKPVARSAPRPGPPVVARGMGMPATPAIPTMRRVATSPSPRRPGGPPAQPMPSQRGKSPARQPDPRRGQAASAPARPGKNERNSTDQRRRPNDTRRPAQAPAAPEETPVVAPMSELAGAMRPAIRFFGGDAKRLTIADLRRAIVLRELMAAPVALRQPGSEQGLF